MSFSWRSQKGFPQAIQAPFEAFGAENAIAAYHQNQAIVMSMAIPSR
jgi:hypothetical protein